jgi:hypothetical protein
MLSSQNVPAFAGNVPSGFAERENIAFISAIMRSIIARCSAKIRSIGPEGIATRDMAEGID